MKKTNTRQQMIVISLSSVQNSTSPKKHKFVMQFRQYAEPRKIVSFQTQNRKRQISHGKTSGHHDAQIAQRMP